MDIAIFPIGLQLIVNGKKPRSKTSQDRPTIYKLTNSSKRYENLLEMGFKLDQEIGNLPRNLLEFLIEEYANKISAKKIEEYVIIPTQLIDIKRAEQLWERGLSNPYLVYVRK